MTSLSEYVSEQRGKNQSGIGLITNSFKSIGIGQRLTGVLSNWNGNRVNDDNLNEPLIDENNENNDTSSSWFNLSNRKNSNDNGNDCFGLGYLQRVGLTVMFIIMAIICFVSAGFLIPVLVFYTKKFATLNTIGCICLMTGLSFLIGWRNFFKVLISDKRRTVSITYILSIILTLFVSISINNVILTTIAAIFQMLALVWFMITFLPFGEKIINFWNSIIFGSRVSNILPI